MIDVVQMNKSGLWKGITHNRIGFFKFINVEILNERVPRCSGELEKTKWNRKSRHKPRSVQELLQRMNLQVSTKELNKHTIVTNIIYEVLNNSYNYRNFT